MDQKVIKSIIKIAEANKIISKQIKLLAEQSNCHVSISSADQKLQEALEDLNNLI